MLQISITRIITDSYGLEAKFSAFNVVIDMKVHTFLFLLLIPYALYLS